MKSIMVASNEFQLYHVISEPGDATRYDYFVYKDYDEYCFMPRESTFNYPQRLNYWFVKDLTDEEIFTLSGEKRCNPFTLKECIRTINELQER